MRGRRLIREQDTRISDLLCRDTADEQHAAHVSVRGDAHIRQDEEIVRVPRICDRGHPRHIQMPCLEPSVQLCRRRAQDIQSLRSPVCKRVCERQHIQKRNMPQTRYHTHPLSFSPPIIILLRGKIQYFENTLFYPLISELIFFFLSYSMCAEISSQMMLPTAPCARAAGIQQMHQVGKKRDFFLLGFPSGKKRG